MTLMAVGCVTEVGDEEAGTSMAQGEASTSPLPVRKATPHDSSMAAPEDQLSTEEAQALFADEAMSSVDASLGGDACRAACAVSYAALCRHVIVLCATATVVTIGSTSIPCGTTITAACVGGAGLAAICGGRCPA